MKYLSFVAAMLVALPLLAQEPASPAKEPGKLVKETWQTAKIGDERSGYMHLTIRELEANGKKYFRGSRKLSLTVKRFGQPVRIEATQGTDETEDGTVVGVFMKQGLAQNIELTLRGIVEGEQLHVVADGKMKFDRKIPWDPKTLGLWSEQQLLAKTKPKVGDEFDYVIYEPNFNSLVKVHAKAEVVENVSMPGQDPKLTLLRVKTDPAKLGDFTVPGAVTWYDGNFQPVRSETMIPGLGKFVFEDASREAALAPCVGPDIGLRQSIVLKKPLASGHGGSQATYRIRVQENDPMKVVAQDARQSLTSIDKNTVQLAIAAIRQPPAEAKDATPPGKEFTESNNYLTSADALVKRHAVAAVGTETDPWKKSLLIERWVKKNMKPVTFSEAMAPASEVAKTLQGDCTEFSMLSAAMARAAGVPSRTAVGLVYVLPRNGELPMLAFHMWHEVWVRGQWIALDSTLGLGSIGTGHIKITDHSWHDVATMTPLLPVMRFLMSGPTIELVSEVSPGSSVPGQPQQTP